MNDCLGSHGLEHNVDWSQQNLGELIDHIVEQHHSYLRRELPVLIQLAEQSQANDLPNASAIRELRQVLSALAEELMQHMQKEEFVLFPWITQLESSTSAGDAPHCGTVAGPIEVMQHEHEFATTSLLRLRQMTNHFAPGANTSVAYRRLLAGLTAIDVDLREHIHKENDILFPRALQLESSLASNV